ncbi:MAG TPA: tetratricopeptide repeat protein [Planctomycetota bacterium]|nr:tetratricopeptide repeat protein [Planctomycetota bacterium]
MGKRGLVIALCAGLLGGLAYRFTRPAPEAPPEGPRFADPATCFECHAEETRAWRGSQHDLAMQVANGETVLGDFHDVEFVHKGALTRFTNRRGRYFVYTQGPDGRDAEFEVKYTFGVTPLQQYLVELPKGRIQALTIAWDVKEKRWFPLHDEDLKPGDPLHWTGLAYNWNHMCAECHSTGVRKSYDAASDRFRTTWFEINVGCQGCHGPGADHVAWARRVAETREGYAADDPKGLPVRLKGRVEVEHCARCHARRSVVDEDYRYGAPFLDHYDPALLEPDLYHADGQMLDEVYNYGSFLQSRMYAKGVRCTDCHEPHTARLRLEGNVVCQRCHNESPPPQFGTLKPKVYDAKSHHFHEPGTPGSRCVECHMPAVTYMVVDPRHDHSFRIPRPDLTAKLGIPNTCNTCHKDKTAAWAAEAIDRWYPREEPRPPHFAEAFAAGRDGDPAAVPALRQVFLDPEQPGIVRATALELLSRYGDVEALARGARDEDPLVRVEAARGVPDPAAAASFLAPLLADPLRLVRVEAARTLAGVPEALPDHGALDGALAEFRARQKAMLDRPEAHLNLGALHEATRDPRRAELEYRRALEILPLFWPARANLSVLMNATGRNAEAERLLDEGTMLDPENGEAWYSFGLLLAEEGKLREAADALGQAARRVPRARVFYNQGVALQKLGALAQAEDALLAGYRIAGNDPAILHALAILYAQRGEPKRALPYARRLLDTDPASPDARRLVQALEAEAKR